MVKKPLRAYLEQKAAAREVEFTALMDAACEELVDELGAARVAALVLADGRSHLAVVASRSRGPGGEAGPTGRRLALEPASVAEQFLSLREPLGIPDAASDPRLASAREDLERLGARSVLLLPLLVEGEVRGVLAALYAGPEELGRCDSRRGALLAREVERELARVRPGETRRRLLAALEQTPESVTPPGAAARAAPASASLPGGTETVLLVDDEALVRQALGRALRSFGYRVLEAQDVDEALRAVDRAAGEVKLVVSDVGMPGQGGADLARRLLAGGATVKLIFMSGFGDEELEPATLEDPRVRYLQKPFNVKTLAGVVRELLDGGRAGGGE